MTMRQTITVDYPDTFGPFQLGGTFANARIIEATTPVRLPDRSLLTIKIEIDRPLSRINLIDEVSESILDFLADDAEGQREPLVTAFMRPTVREVDITNIVT